MKTSTIIFLFILSLVFQVFPMETQNAVKVSTVLKTTTSWDGKPIEYPTGKAEVTGMVIEVAVGGETGWHKHPVASFAMILEGELEVQLKDGSIKRVKSGDSFAEVTNTFHNGRNIGTVPVKLVVFYTGIADQTLTIKEND